MPKIKKIIELSNKSLKLIGEIPKKPYRTNSTVLIAK